MAKVRDFRFCRLVGHMNYEPQNDELSHNYAYSWSRHLLKFW